MPPPREPPPVRDLARFERHLSDFTMAELRAASRIIGRLGRQRVESVPNMGDRGRRVEQQLDVLAAPEFSAALASQQATEDWVLAQLRASDLTREVLRARMPLNMTELGVDEAIRTHVRTGAIRAVAISNGLVAFRWAAREAADAHRAQEALTDRGVDRVVFEIVSEAPGRFHEAEVVLQAAGNLSQHSQSRVRSEVQRLVQRGVLTVDQEGGLRVVEGPVLEDVQHEDWVVQQLRTGNWFPWTSIYDVGALRPAHLTEDGVWHALERLVQRGTVLARMDPDDVERYSLPREGEAATMAQDPDGDRPTLQDERRADAAVLHQVLYADVLTIAEVPEALMRGPNPLPVEHYEASIQRLLRRRILREVPTGIGPVFQVTQIEVAQALLDPDEQEERITSFVQRHQGVARRDEVARRLTDGGGGSLPQQSIILQTIQRLIERGVLIEREALVGQRVLSAPTPAAPTPAPLSDKGELRQRILELVGDGGRRKERIIEDLTQDFDSEPGNAVMRSAALDLMILGGALTEREGRVWPKGAVPSVPEPLDALDQILADDD